MSRPIRERTDEETRSMPRRPISTSLRVLYFGGVTTYRALFNFRHPTVYIPSMLVAPVLAMVFYTYLGRFSVLADDTFFVIGNAAQAGSMAGIYGMVMGLVNEREFGTLSAVFATPARRLPLFLGRSIPLIGIGLFGCAFTFVAGFLLLNVRIPLTALPEVALILALTTVTVAMFGLTVGALSLRVGDLWVGSNITYTLMLLLCGVNVPPSAMPGWLAGIGRALPLTHGIQAARGLAAGRRLSDVAGQIGMEATIGAGYAVLGYVLLRLFEVENRRRASLS
jgi:ABC-2 type transport system permease protein